MCLEKVFKSGMHPSLSISVVLYGSVRLNLNSKIVSKHVQNFDLGHSLSDIMGHALDVVCREFDIG